MSITWAQNLLSGSWGAIVTTATSSPAYCNVSGTATTACQGDANMVSTLQNFLFGVINATYPTLIAVAVLFAFYYVLKSLYHSRM